MSLLTFAAGLSLAMMGLGLALCPGNGTGAFFLWAGGLLMGLVLPVVRRKE